MFWGGWRVVNIEGVKINGVFYWVEINIVMVVCNSVVVIEIEGIIVI